VSLQLVAGHIESMKESNEKMKQDHGLAWLEPLIWFTWLLREVWYLMCCFNILVKDWFSTCSFFFIGITFTELTANLLPAILIYILRQHIMSEMEEDASVDSKDKINYPATAEKDNGGTLLKEESSIV